MIKAARAGTLRVFFLSTLACTWLAFRASAQVAPPSSYDMPLVQDTGVVSNTSASPQIVASFIVSVPGANSLRLKFSQITLAGDVALGTGSKLRMTSVLDGGTQELDAQRCAEWQNSSCYFNGDSVEVDIVADPGTGPNQAVLSEVVVDVPMHALTICGPTDDRVLSNEPGQARVLPTGCTTWMISDCTHCFLTAGHCVAGLGVVEFNVPLSTPAGDIQHPGPEDQYVMDPHSLQYINGGQGNDWAYYGCFTNPVTGLSPYDKQRASYILAQAAPAENPNITIRVSGYGVDLTPAELNQVQQTAVGPYGPPVGNTIIQYAVDTTGGNSGSPVIWEATGLAIGIHTNGGCFESDLGFNTGTSIANPNLQAALSHPHGVCAQPCSPSATTYCTQPPDPPNCEPHINVVGIPSATIGPGSFFIQSTSVSTHKTGMLLYSHNPGGQPFVGGYLCVGSPFVRTSAQNSNGTADFDDCTGSYSFDMGEYIALGSDPTLGIGTTIFAQYWARNPPGSPYYAKLSSAIQFILGP